MKTSVQKLFALLLFFSSLQLSLSAQTGCPNCVVDLPVDLPRDTIYLGEIDQASVGVYYDFDLSFRVPKSTTPVNALDSTIQGGVKLDKIEITSLTNLPPGLFWQANKREFDVKDNDTDGCIKFCGTPLQAGIYEVEVELTASISIINRSVSFPIIIEVTPPSSTNSGFTVFNSTGCGETTVTFENNNPSNGKDGFSYNWDFGNGQTSIDENPAPVTYDQPGTYTINYEAIIDTQGYFLTEIRLEETGCDDIIGKPDIVFEVTDPNGQVVFTSSEFRNTDLPVSVSLNVKLGPGNYLLTAVDKDSGLEFGDDECVTTNINQLSDGEIVGDDFKLQLTIVHPVQTIQVSDIITVYDLPLAPLVEIEGSDILCEGDTKVLTAMSSGILQWYRNGEKIDGATTDTLTIDSSGNYQVEIISNEGCTNLSDPAEIELEALPAAPEIEADRLVFCRGNNASLTTSSYTDGLQWYFDGIPINGATDAQYFARNQGIYYLEYTNANGCTSASQGISITVNDLPEQPVFYNDNNLLVIDSTVNLPASYTIQWFLNGDEVFPDIIPEELCATESGQYNAVITDLETGCKTSYSADVVYDPDFSCITVSTTTLEDIADWKIYPNPTFGELHIDVDLKGTQEASLELYGLSGRLLSREIFNQSLNGHTIDVSQYAVGMYLVKLQIGDQIETRKLMKK